MAIAVEGLHRRLWPKDRVMSRGQASKTRRLARAAVDDPDLRQRVGDALLHLEEPTYAERLHSLTELVTGAVPAATGETPEWERRIKAVRNGFAHQTAPRVTATDARGDEWQ